MVIYSEKLVVLHIDNFKVKYYLKLILLKCRYVKKYKLFGYYLLLGFKTYCTQVVENMHLK